MDKPEELPVEGVDLTVRGARFLAEPVDHGGEIRTFFRDPDGHLLEISEVGQGASSSGSQGKRSLPCSENRRVASMALQQDSRSVR